jgi:hypothetical protein
LISTPVTTISHPIRTTLSPRSASIAVIASALASCAVFVATSMPVGSRVGLRRTIQAGELSSDLRALALVAAAAEKLLVTPRRGISDDELKAKLLGRWKLIDHGERIIENRADGTATMDLHFDFVASLLYGREVRLKLKWVVEDGILKYDILDGFPAEKKDRLIQDHGARASYVVDAASEREMKLTRTVDPDEKYLWTRID